MKQTNFSKTYFFSFFLLFFCLFLLSNTVGAACIEGNCTNGSGTFLWPNGNSYTGSFVDGLMQGEGTQTWTNGNLYIGEYNAGQRNGHGTFTWKNGNRYTGTFKNGSIQGTGTLNFNSGETYKGSFENDTMNGEGTLLWPNGDQYVGSFSNGKMNGIGTFQWNNGDIYIGMFRDELITGTGTFQWRNGNRYDGTFSYNKAGIGSQTDREGKTRSGLMRMGGKIVSIVSKSQGEEHGFLPNDIVTTYNKTQLIGGARDLANMAANTPTAQEVTVTIIRNEKVQKINMHGGRIGIELIDYPYFEPDVMN